MSGLLCSGQSILTILVLLIVFVFGAESTKTFVSKVYKQINLMIKSRQEPQGKALGLEKQLLKDDEYEVEEEPEMGQQEIVEEFNNDLYNSDVEIDLESSDYEAALKSMVLEPVIFEQHKKFNQELMHRVGGTSSRNPVRDDNIDVVPWVGLRRPQYQKINPNDSSARTVPSVKDSDDLANYQQIMWKHAA